MSTYYGDTSVIYSGTTFVGSSTNITSASGGVLNVSGDMTVGASKTIHFAQGGSAAPSFTTRSAGTKIVLYPEVGSSASDYALGMESNAMWSSVSNTSGSFKWYAGTTLLMQLTSTILNIETRGVIDVTNTEAFLVRKNADVGDVFAIDTTNTSIKLGPGEGIQNSLLSLYGTSSNATLGPHIMATTTEDIYPVFQLFNSAHDIITLNFDSYFADATSDTRSSHLGSNFQIAKFSNSLQFNYASSVSQGSAITFSTGMFLANDGVLSTRTILPSTTNAYNLGSASFQWQNIFSQNAVTVSDKRQKKNIIPERFGLDFINKLRPVEYTYKSTNSRAHGLIAQEVEQAVQDHGINTSEFYMYDQDADIYNMKYMELTSPLIKSIQELTQRILQLELQLANLQA
jgi:Chaperone of endosialidase